MPAPVRLAPLLPLVALLALSCTTRDRAPDADAPLFAVTTPPVAAVVLEVVGDRGGVETLLDGGASPHTHDPRPSHARLAARSTALFHAHPALDAWAADLGAPRPVALSGLLPDSLRRTAADGRPADPHFWLDPPAVRALLPALADTLCTLDAAGCTGYRERADASARRLAALHDELARMTAPLRGRALVLAHPFLVRFAHRYDLIVAGVVEPAPGREPSPRRVQELVEQARAHDVAAVVTMPQHPSRAARAVARGADVPLVEIDPIGTAGMGYETLLRDVTGRLSEGLR